MSEPVGEAGRPLRRVLGLAVVSLLAGVTVGALGAAVGNWCGWRSVDPPVSEGEAREVVTLAAPQVSTWRISWHDDIKDVDGIDRPNSGDLPGQRIADNWETALGIQGFADARERLRGAGWRIEEVSDSPERHFFLAHRNGLVAEWEYTPLSRHSDGGKDFVRVWLWRATPSAVWLATGIGCLAGALLGVGIALAIRRLPAGTRRRRLTVVGFGVIITLSFPTLAAIAIAVLNLRGPAAGGQPVALWLAYLPCLVW